MVLDKEISVLKDQLKSDIEAINSSAKVAGGNLAGKQAQETGQLSVGIANAGGYLGFSGSGTGVMLKLAESHRAELSALDAKRQQAIADATRANNEKRFDVVRLKAAEIARIDQETYDRTEKYNAEVKKKADADKVQAEQQKTQQDVFAAIQGGAKTPEAIFKQLKGAVDIKDINDFLKGIGEGSSDLKFKYSSTDTASLLGSGMGGGDIQALQEYVNEHGYTEDVRGTLTPTQRAAADKIYRQKTGASLADGTDKVVITAPDGTTIHDTTMQIIDGFTTLKELTPTAKAKAKQELYALGFNNEVVPKWFDQTTVEDMVGEPLSAEFLQNHYRVDFEPTQFDSAFANYTKRFIQESWAQTRNTVLNTDGETSGATDSGTGLDDYDSF